MTDSAQTETPAAPLLRVVSGDPTAEELAALVAVVSARQAAASAASTPVKKRSEWGHPARAVRQPLRLGTWH